MAQVKDLSVGTYLVRHDIADYRVSPDFHNCTYSLIDLDENPNTRHSFHFLSWEEVEEIAERVGYQIINIQ